MSAEKEIVNYWFNKKGFFTISNLKAGNKELGILAVNTKSKEAMHVQVSCSLTSKIDSKEMAISAKKISAEKFYDKQILGAVMKDLSSLDNSSLKRVLVLSSVPISRKESITKEFGSLGIQVIEFENILYDSLEGVDTQYYKNDIIRTLQLVKFLLFNEPRNLARLPRSLSASSKKEFLVNILGNDDIVKEFRKTNSERLAIILKNSNVNPKDLAAMLDNTILNNKTRKLFLDSFMDQEKTRKIVNKARNVQKKVVSLQKFI